MPRLATSKGLSNKLRYALVAALAFSIGSTATVTAGPVVSGFVGLIDGENTAAINASRELSVTDAVARSRLAEIGSATGQLTFDAWGNLKTASEGTQMVDGTVNVGNFPTTQNVSGTVSVANFPATQSVSGTVNVGNFPATQNIAGTVGVSTVPQTRELFNNSSVIAVSAGQLRGLATIDVSSSERIRVAAFNASFSNAARFGFSMVAGDGNLVALLDRFDVPPRGVVVKSYDLPGRSLALSVDQTGFGGGPAGEVAVRLTIWGR